MGRQVPRPADGMWEVGIPAPLAAIMCGAFFWLGYRTKAWVLEKIDAYKKFKTRFSEGFVNAAWYTTEALLLGVGIFLVKRNLK
mmetsp:Transcript_68336/g.110958  ORF Transcript_68336/g.110958 Transcript_68336/m.110958 type:complete len:84 (-) Transcript_68336:838-1089(-)